MPRARPRPAQSQACRWAAAAENVRLSGEHVRPPPHCAGVAQLNRLGNIGGRQLDGTAVPDVPHRQVTAAADLKHGPPVAIPHPIRGRHPQCCWPG
jgi:hypothetical protein